MTPVLTTIWIVPRSTVALAAPAGTGCDEPSRIWLLRVVRHGHQRTEVGGHFGDREEAGGVGKRNEEAEKHDVGAGDRVAILVDNVSTHGVGGIGDQWIQPEFHFNAIGNAVAIGVGIQRIGAEPYLLGVGQSVAIGVGVQRVCAAPDLFAIGNAIAGGVGSGRGGAWV